ncbi:DUF1524 domain-containing protein [Nonomuraea sp. NPDC050540]|uniref:GmrSD restriction endonuclease domain-containing protein n=1 Tax=Nonomuraea sp. NPDC050540 TaxID=3364367 RepID=UPI00378CEBF5
MRRSFALVAATAVLLTIPLSASPALADPPGVPDLATAQAELAALTVAPESHDDTYDRALFPHWSTVSGACNTRETVLIRDGQDVVTNPSTCAPISGTWVSPYDGGVWSQASDIDIDHMVALKEGWRSGAWAWTTTRRKAFANSLDDSQLWSVTDNINQSKGDQDPSTWRPPLTSFHCTYAKSWIDVKYDWSLSAQPSEVDALHDMLATC